MNLGTLTYGKRTFNKLEEILALRTTGAMPVIPTSAPSGGVVGPLDDRLPMNGRAPIDDRLPLDDRAVPDAAGWATSTHPLVVHLTALAELHQRGALTDEEFAAAKARLLADPEN